MNKPTTIALTLAVAAVSVAVLALQMPVAFSSSMSDILTMNATDAKIHDDLETHRWSIEEAIRWNPHDYHALYRLGYYHAERKEFERAREVYESCIEKSPGHLGALLGLADIYTRAGEFDRAREMAERALHVAPTSWRAFLAAGMIESRSGELDEALRLLKKADRFARGPESGVYNQMGLAYLLAGDGEHALRSAERSLRLNRKDAEALLVKGKALALLGRPEESVPVLRLAIHHAAGDARQVSDARLHLAGALVETGAVLESSELVRDEVRESAELMPVRQTATRVLRRLDARLSEDTLPAETLGEVQCNIGFAYAAMGTLEDAADHFEAAESSGAPLEASCIWAHAETLMRLDRTEDAIARYETAISMGPAPVQMRLGLAEALTEAGRTGDARMQYLLLLRGHDLSDEERARIEALNEELN